MNDKGDYPDSRVCKTEGGQFIAFWRGQLVYKLDGSLRYFETDDAARCFLARRDSVSNSMVGKARRAGRAKLMDRG